MRIPDENAQQHERLQWARERAGFSTTREAADRFGWVYSTYKSHENGIRGFKKRDAEKYAKAFRVSVAWLITGQGDFMSSLSPDERKLLEKYRILDDHGKYATQALTDALVAPNIKPDKVAV